MSHKIPGGVLGRPETYRGTELLNYSAPTWRLSWRHDAGAGHLELLLQEDLLNA